MSKATDYSTAQVHVRFRNITINGVGLNDLEISGEADVTCNLADDADTICDVERIDSIDVAEVIVERTGRKVPLSQKLKAKIVNSVLRGRDGDNVAYWTEIDARNEYEKTRGYDNN